MILFKKSRELQDRLSGELNFKKKIGFVPTMGALHAGHISLVEASKNENDITVCSIFINPAQFNDPKDYEKYPVTLEKDIYQLETAGCDILFLPTVNEIYPGGMIAKKFELGRLDQMLEGKFRPGHFQGVCLVMERLLDLVNPDNLYMGQKDYQQCLVIKKLLEPTLSHDKIRITVCPTLREPDGLAMSSRNLRLNEEDRKAAPAIYNVLQYIKNSFKPGNLSSLRSEAVKKLETAGFRVDYAEIADANDLSPITDWDGRQKGVALIAAFLHDIRLIDNLTLN